MFVTHAPDLVLRICDRVVLLQKGAIHAPGDPEEVVRDFRLLDDRDQDLAYATEQGTKEIEIVSAARSSAQDGATRRVVRARRRRW